MPVVWVLTFSLLISAGAISAAALFLLAPRALQQKVLPYLICFAIGTLLASALVELLPHAIDEIGATPSLMIVLTGLVGFFVLERWMIWHHCHVLGTCDVHVAVAPLIIVGDALHNFVDGIVLAAAFLSSVPLGIASGLAIIAHEVPQEVGDFAILLDRGFSRNQAFFRNLLSGSAIFPGAVLAMIALEWLEAATPYVLSLAAAGFLYIGLADLIPGIHERLRPAIGLAQFLSILLGIATILLLHTQHG